METVVGIFHLSSDAAQALTKLSEVGFGKEIITVLCPGTSDQAVERAVPTSDSESEGMGEALGGTVGGAIGAAAGATLGLAAASLFLPGVGPILVAGVLGAAVAGSGGALIGVAAGQAAEHGLAPELSHDELFIYEDALRQGHTVLIVYAENGERAEQAREVLMHAGAEAIDAARENWWSSLRGAEAAQYQGDFKRDEATYRRGFETALRTDLRGKELNEVVNHLDESDQAICDSSAFKAGFDRGHSHQCRLEAACPEPETTRKLSRVGVST